MIKEIILNGYDRFFLNNIESITYAPKQKFQLILGSNGSGKSSLLSELNPLPINKTDFRENGFKEITKEKNGSTFVLKSTINKNSFKKDNIELNPGGTKKVQLNLIREYFNLTPRYNNVVLGIEKLTTMSTNDRKQYLREMSTVDYAYGIYLYNSLKQQLRDTVGYLKVVQIELNNDVTSTVEGDDVKVLKDDIESIKNLIDSLSMMYQKSEDFKTIIPVDMSILKHRVPDPYKVELEISNKYGLLKTVEKEIDTLNKEIDELDEYAKTSKDSEELRSNISLLEIYFSKLNSKYPDDTFINKNKISDRLNSYKNKTDVIYGIVTELSYLDDIKFTAEEYKENKSLRDELINKRDILSRSLDNLSKELEITLANKNENNKITCTSCGTFNYFGYSVEKENQLTEKVEDTKSKLETMDMKVEEINTLYLKQKSKIDHLLELKNNISELGLLDMYTHYITKHNIKLLELSSTVLNVVLKNIESTLTDYLDYEEYMTKLHELSYKLKLDNEIMEIYKKRNQDDKHKLLSKLDTLLEKKRNLITDIDTLKNEMVKAKEAVRVFEKMKEDLEAHKFNRRQITINNKNKIIMDSIKELKMLLIDLEDKYNNIEKVKERIEFNKKLISQYEEERIALNYAVNALSPTEGLIAKSINSFINVFLNEMNTIINSVWSYDITLMPCQVNENNDLDYLFAVKVDNKKDIDDVKFLSTSMKDIVDLSFKIVFMKYMKLTDSPLFLDEFGVFMDDVHRNKVYHVIENILGNNFSQIFFTANFKSIYGRFVDSDIVILDDKNLELEDLTYNTNIEIRR